jgi:hypothetical protein
MFQEFLRKKKGEMKYLSISDNDKSGKSLNNLDIKGWKFFSKLRDNIHFPAFSNDMLIRWKTFLCTGTSQKHEHHYAQC